MHANVTDPFYYHINNAYTLAGVPQGLSCLQCQSMPQSSAETWMCLCLLCLFWDLP